MDLAHNENKLQIIRYMYRIYEYRLSVSRTAGCHFSFICRRRSIKWRITRLFVKKLQRAIMRHKNTQTQNLFEQIS
jgi:hypothetical protein